MILLAYLVGVFTVCLLAAKKGRSVFLHLVMALFLPFAWIFQIVYLLIVQERRPYARRRRTIQARVAPEYIEQIPNA